MKHFYYLFVLFALLWSKNIFAYDIAVKNADGVIIYYNYINDGKELEVTYNYWSNKQTKTVGYEGVKELIIPQEVVFMNRTRKVTSIGNNAFYANTDLTSITIPNSITSILSESFYNCKNLKSVHISDLEAWCKIKFKSNPLNYHLYLNGEEIKELNVPNGVTTLERTFRGCSGLTSVIIPNSVTSIGESAFQSCSGLISVTIGNSVTSIGKYAFSGCSGLTSVTIPNNVTNIDYAAFYMCVGLTSVIIPNSVTSIGEYNQEIKGETNVEIIPVIA